MLKTIPFILILAAPVRALDFDNGVDASAFLSEARASLAESPQAPILRGGAVTPASPLPQDPKNRALAHLLSLKQEHLDNLYKTLPAGPIPNGKARGRAAFFPGTLLGTVTQIATALFWQGKIFDLKDGSMANRILGFTAIKAKIFYGKSKLDSRKSIILDYAETSRAAGMIIDEIRLVAPNIYLGRGYMRTPFGNIHLLNFALDFRAENI